MQHINSFMALNTYAHRIHLAGEHKKRENALSEVPICDLLRAADRLCRLCFPFTFVQFEFDRGAGHIVFSVSSLSLRFKRRAQSARKKNFCVQISHQN